MKQNITGWKHANWRFWILSVYLFFVFLTGGSSRSDVQSLAFLWPISVMVFAIGIFNLKLADLQRYRTICIFAAAVSLLLLLYLLPMPRSLLQIAAFDLVRSIEATAGAGPLVHSAALVPMEVWGSIHALFIPLAVLVLAIQLGREDLYRLLPLIIGLGLLSGFVGFLQILGNSEGPLYLYDVTNNGRAVGLFANRNHQALLLAMLFPMLAVFASIDTQQGMKGVGFKGWIAIAAGAFLVPLLLVTGSRAGLIFGGFALFIAIFLYRRLGKNGPTNGKASGMKLRIALAALGTLLLGTVSVLFSRAEAINRLAEGGSENRVDFWLPIAALANSRLPFGIGPGGLGSAYTSVEPTWMLDSSYLNRAHNDWLELYSSFGIFACALAIAATIAFGVRCLSIFKARHSGSRQLLFSQLGAVMVVIAALGSIVDYPLRTPIMGAVVVIGLVWFVFAPPSISNTAKERQPDGFPSG